MSSTLLIARRVFAGASVAWALLLPLAPWAASRPDPSLWLWSFAVAMYGAGSMLCHQLPARSFHLWSRQLPVCARCTGIYVGAALAVVAATCCRGRAAALFRRAGSRRDQARRVLLVAALPTAATLLFEWAAVMMPAHWVRALAGLPLGAAVAWVVIRVN